ncbi:unnamed protein product, partial [Medioppia subpectinata]
QVQTQVWLTVSPLADKTSQRLIEINWRNAPKTNQNDWIGIFTSDPIDSTGAIRKLMVDDRLNGYNVTDIQFPYRNFATGKLTQQCLGYYIAYIHNDIVFAKNCIKNNPFWMENNLAIIGDKTLPSLMIPGTHDSGAYEKWGPKSVGDIVRGFMIAHDESLYNQMVYGIRYLDMRVGYHNVSETDDKLWIVHGLFRTDHTLRSAAEQVRDFLKAAPKEIVIFDFHRFVTGFNDEKNADILRMRYKEFFDVVESELKDLMIPFSLSSTTSFLIAPVLSIGSDVNIPIQSFWTDIQFPYRNFATGKLTQQCLGYYIGYLDMRVGYHNVSETDDKLWIVHGLFRTDHTLRSAAEQVRDFLKAAPKEIVIFDFHRFVTGFNDEKNADILRMRYKEFFDVVESELKDLMIPFRYCYKLSNFSIYIIYF